MQLDEREGEGQGGEEGLSAGQSPGTACRAATSADDWKSSANPNSPPDSRPKVSLATPSSARVRLSVRYCRNLASARSPRSASTALSLAWPALVAVSRLAAGCIWRCAAAWSARCRPAASRALASAAMTGSRAVGASSCSPSAKAMTGIPSWSDRSPAAAASSFISWMLAFLLASAAACDMRSRAAPSAFASAVA